MKRIFFAAFSSAVLLVGCSKSETAPTVVTLKVKAPAYGYTIKVYESRTAFLNNQTPLANAITGVDGTVTLTGIPKLGYVYADDGFCNNSFYDSSTYNVDAGIKTVVTSKNAIITIQNNSIYSFDVFKNQSGLAGVVAANSKLVLPYQPLGSYFFFLANKTVNSDYRNVNFNLVCGGQTIIIN